MMSGSSTTVHHSSAMRSPVESTVSRWPPSIRRTSHVDIGTQAGQLQLIGGARDLITLDRTAEVADEASAHAVIGGDRTLLQLHTTPARPAAELLIGRTVAAGFRDAVRDALPDDVATGTSLALLLDDLPVAALISGYALLYSGSLESSDGIASQHDICSGWRTGGTMLTSVHHGDGVPVTVGPRAPELSGDDPLAWHEMAPMQMGWMRRRRLVDIALADTADIADISLAITAMFRDSHVGPDGTETVLHEYSLTARVDQTTQTFTSCAAVPRVLPFVECPVAAASADRMVGTHVDSVRQFVRADLRGVSTCTHLNDLLRSLGDIGTLAATLHTRLRG